MFIGGGGVALHVLDIKKIYQCIVNYVNISVLKLDPNMNTTQSSLSHRIINPTLGQLLKTNIIATCTLEHNLSVPSLNTCLACHTVKVN